MLIEFDINICDEKQKVENVLHTHEQTKSFETPLFETIFYS